jgi:phosphate/phosphite/phosphonate ABC transporter binding protein
MRKIERESLEFKYLIFVIALLIGGILWTGIISFSAISLEKMYGKSWNFIMWTALIGAAGISIVAFLFWIVARRLVIKPIQSIEKTARAIADGDLSFRLNIGTNDEIGRMSSAMNQSLSSLGDIFQRVASSSQRVKSVAGKVGQEFEKFTESTKLESEAISDIATSLEQMNSAAAEIAQSVERLAASTEEKAASMEEMVTSISEVANSAQELSHAVDSTSVSVEQLSSTIREVAHKSEELAASSEETLAASEELSSSIREVEQSAKDSALLSEKVKNDASTFGMESVAKTVEGIQNIKLSFENTSNFIKKLGGRSNEIGKILNVIDEITDQTTLLALNAAILAAQAGEHGKGFSVVADEIKDLADRTSFSTREIADLIQSVQQEVQDAIVAMEEGIRSVEEGLTVARDAGNALGKIVESSIQSAEMSHSIERSTTEQARTTRLVSDSMEKVKNMVAQIAKTTQEQSKGALHITHTTERMRDVAGHVKNATGEQLISARQISEAIELVSEKSQQIVKSVNEQKSGAGQIFKSIEKIRDIPKENLERIFTIDHSLKGLSKNTELLTNELKKIRLPEEKKDEITGAYVIRFGIEPVGAPAADISAKFKPLADYLGKKLGRKVELRVSADFEGALRDIGNGSVQISFLSPVTYIMARKKFGVEVLVTALVGGRPAYRSAIIAGTSGKINSLEDIKGHNFAFGDRHSLSGHIAPRTVLLDAGIQLKDLLHYEYLGSDKAVADAVLGGGFDAGGVEESTAYVYQGKGLRLIKFSEDLPGASVCTAKNFPQYMKDTLESALVSLTDATPEGSSILSGLMENCTGFGKASDTDFTMAKNMMSRLGMF